jgi:hypothetical protein
MKKIIYSLLMIALFSSCSENKFEKGEEAFKKKHYSTAYTYYIEVSKDDKFYNQAQKRLIEIEEIEEKLDSEREIKDSLDKVNQAKKDKNKTIELFNKNLNIIKDFNGDEYRNTVDAILSELDLFQSMSILIDKSSIIKDNEIYKLSNELKNKLISLQRKEFPKMRKNYGEVLNDKLWSENIEVKTKGNGSSTLEFIGGSFANNKNKEETQNTLREVLARLRFKRVNYLWFKYDDEYTYYSMDSENDDSIIY